MNVIYSHLYSHQYQHNQLMNLATADDCRVFHILRRIFYSIPWTFIKSIIFIVLRVLNQSGNRHCSCSLFLYYGVEWINMIFITLISTKSRWYMVDIKSDDSILVNPNSHKNRRIAMIWVVGILDSSKWKTLFTTGYYAFIIYLVYYTHLCGHF